MKKRILSICIFTFVVFTTVNAIGNKDVVTDKTKPETIRVGAFVGPSGVGMAYLFENSTQIDGISFEYEAFASVDILLPKLINKDIDIGILPPNVAVKLYNTDPNSIVYLATVGNGMLSIITKDKNIKSINDLSGKKITVAGQGSTPEFVLRTILKKESMEDVEFDFSIPIPEIAPSLISGKIEYALTPEPFSTVAVLNSKNLDNPVLKAINIKEVWNELEISNDFPMTLCVANRDFAFDNKTAINIFLSEYNKSIEWTVKNPKDAGELVEKVGLGLKAPIASQAIPVSNYVFKTAKDSKKDLESLIKAFLEFSPVSVGGKMPDDDFYY